MSDFAYDTSMMRIMNDMRISEEQNVVYLNKLYTKGYENTINKWKYDGRKTPVPEPPGSYRVDDIIPENYPEMTMPEVRYHPEIPVCPKYSETAKPQLLTAIVGDAIEGFTPTRYQPLDKLPIGTQGFAPDGKLVTKVGVQTPFGPMVWYQ